MWSFKLKFGVLKKKSLPIFSPHRVSEKFWQKETDVTEAEFLFLSTWSRSSHGFLLWISSCLQLGGISSLLRCPLYLRLLQNNISMPGNFTEQCPDFTGWDSKRRKGQNYSLGMRPINHLPTRSRFLQILLSLNSVNLRPNFDAPIFKEYSRYNNTRPLDLIPPKQE